MCTVSLRFKFKALELNRKILEAAVVPKKPLAKEATQPECFHLEIEKRLHERQASKKPKEVDDYTFHSNPVPARIMEEVVVCIMCSSESILCSIMNAGHFICSCLCILMRSCTVSC